MGQLRGVHQPPEVGACLGRAAELEERIEGEGRVANPAVAMVPVAFAADLLRQRGRRGGGDRAGWRVHKQLQRQGATNHRVPIGALVGVAGDPVPPDAASGLEPLLQLCTGREHQRLLVRGTERDDRSGPGRRLETGFDRLRIELRTPRLERAHRQRVGPYGGDPGRPFGTQPAPAAHRSRSDAPRASASVHSRRGPRPGARARGGARAIGRGESTRR
jgi:hypothetical protein